MVTEARPADRWIEANRKFTARKKRKHYVPGGIKENRERLIAAMAEAEHRRLARRDRVFCPECTLVYSRNYMAVHRRKAHGVIIQPSAHHGEYVPSFGPREYASRRVLCPECEATVSKTYISTHRKRYHGVTSPRVVHIGYTRVP